MVSLNTLFPGVCDANHAASNASARVAYRLAAIVHLRVHNHAAADDWILHARNRNVAHGDLVVRFALVVGGKIAKVAAVTHLLLRETMLVAFGVVMPACAHAVGRGAITELMNVEGVLLARVQAFDVGDDFHRVAFLRETHGAVTFVAGSRVQYGDDLLHGSPGFAVGLVAMLRRTQRTG